MFGAEGILLFGEWDPISLKERCNLAVKATLRQTSPKKEGVFQIFFFFTLVCDGPELALVFTSDNVQGGLCHGMVNVVVQYPFSLMFFILHTRYITKKTTKTEIPALRIV